MDAEYAILLADVVGSTKLYGRVGDKMASKLIFECVERMQQVARDNGGVFVRSKGDDALCLFEDVEVAVATARDIVEQGTIGSVSVHAGLHWGKVIRRGDEIFGGSINTAARLADRANENEVLISETIVERLPGSHGVELRAMGPMVLRGAKEPQDVYTLVIPSQDMLTRQIFTPGSQGDAVQFQKMGTRVQLSMGDWNAEIKEGEDISIGRSRHCDLVIPADLVSRVHASITINHGIVEFSDRSSGGSTVQFRDGGDFLLRRQSVSLSGSGRIMLGDAKNERDLPEITFDVTQA